MISKIRRILRLDSISDTLSKINNIDGELSELNSTIGDLALEYTNRNEAKKQLEKSEIGDDILKSVNERFGNYQKSHLDEVLVIKAKKDALEKERNKLMSDDTILKAYSELQSYNKFKKAYKDNNITSQVFDTFLKAKQGKVKYADNLVFNEEGKLLIIQRAKTDKSNPEKWVLPGGHVDVGEEFKSAALRELNEEAGINVTECKKVGEYADNGVEIEYYRSSIKSDEQEVILETEESQDSKWIDVYSELDNYEMVFNMKDNIRKILNIPKDNVVVIKKAIESGMFNQETIDLLKSNKNYSKLINELNKKRDPDNIEKNDTEDDQKEINHLKEMIEEHERLIKILAPHAKMDKKVADELKIQIKELDDYKKKLKHEQKEVELPEKIEKAIEDGLLTDEAVELLKSRTGVYADNAQNRQLKRVGQKYGSSGQPDENPSKNGKQEEKTEPKQATPESLAEDAKNASESKLQEAIENSDSPDVRQAAHNELKRRQDEEHPQEEKFGEPKKEDGVQPKKEESSKPTETKKEDTKPTKEVSKETKNDGGEKNDLETKEGIETETQDLTGKWIKADEVKTGTPIKMSFAHNTEKSPVKYKSMAQDIEPHGTYMLNNDGSHKTEKWEYGDIEFKNPLVLEHNGTDESGWKGELSNRFGKKGKALSQELIKRGYDAIITKDSQYNDLSEIVSLKDFDPKHKDKRKIVKAENSDIEKSDTKEKEVKKDE